MTIQRVRRRLIKSKSALKEIGISKDANLKGQKNKNKTKKNTNGMAPSTSFVTIQSGTKFGFSTADNTSLERCVSGVSIGNPVEGE